MAVRHRPPDAGVDVFRRKADVDDLFLCNLIDRLCLWSGTYQVWRKFNHASIDDVAQSHALQGRVVALQPQLQAVASRGFFVADNQIMQ
jgi:hypothetical protein